MIFLGAIAALLSNEWILYYYAQKDIQNIQDEIRTNRDLLRKELNTFNTETFDRLQEELKILSITASARNDEQANRYEELRKHSFYFAGFHTSA